MKDSTVLARELAKQLQIIAGNTCDWVSEEKILQDIPLTKSQLEKYRADSTLEYGYHYKSIGKQESKDGSARGRKTIIYHRTNMIQFIDQLP